MIKFLIAAAVTALLCAPEAAAQSLVRRSDWRDRTFDTYLPRAPWLEIDTKTKLPKGAIPLGRDVASVGLVLPPRADV